MLKFINLNENKIENRKIFLLQLLKYVTIVVFHLFIYNNESYYPWWLVPRNCNLYKTIQIKNLLHLLNEIFWNNKTKLDLIGKIVCLKMQKYKNMYYMSQLR